VLFAAAWLLVRGRTGRAFRAIRENELAAVSSGVGLPTYKTFAFGVSALYGGVAGSLYAISINYVNPDTFPVALSILLLTGTVVGGLGSLSGVLFGAFFIQYAPRYAPDALDAGLSRLGLDIDATASGAPAVCYGVVLLVFLLVAPSGLAGLLRRLARALTLRKNRPMIASRGRFTSS
jgi:branched-chain amino acid transport system permease protein